MLRAYGNRRVGDGLCTGEGTLRNHHHRTLHVSVRIRHIRDGRAFVDDGGVVYVRDHGGIDRRIADVDLSHVAPAHLVRGHVNFARTEREPSHIAAEAAWATADEDHQRRRIYGLHFHGSGHPPPASANRYPTSVVERRVAPGGIIDPGISPGRNPIPVPGVIGRPPGFNMREPNVAIV